MSSELKTNKVSPATGTALQISDSGDTTTIPSGATMDIASGATLDINGTVDFAGATVSNLSAGKFLQVQHTAYASQASNHNSSSWSTTGSMSVSITPSSASNMILVMSSDSFYIAGNGASNTSSNAAIFETGSSTMVAFKFLGHNGAPASFDPCTMIGIYDPSDTSALTFQTKSYNGGAYYTQPRTNQGQDSGNIYWIIALEYEV
jgi:hypothetical protein